MIGDYAVIELGANHRGEIASTVSLTRPEAALVNNPRRRIWKVSARWPAWRKRKGEIHNFGLPENGRDWRMPIIMTG